MQQVRKSLFTVILSMLLILSTFNAHVQASDRGDQDDWKNLYVKDFSITGEKEYYSGEEIVQHINLSLKDDVGELEDSYIEIEIPKQYIEKDSIKMSDTTSVNFTYELAEKADHYLIKYRFETMSSSTELGIPVKFKTVDYLTPSGVSIPIVARYHFDDKSVENTTHIDIQAADYQVSLSLSEKPLGYVAHSNQENQNLNAGWYDEESQLFVENTEELNTIHVGYVFESLTNLNQDFGNRKFEKLIVEMQLPEDAEFVDQAHFNNDYEWKYDSNRKVAILEDKGVKGKPIEVGNHHTLSFHDLGLQFPGAKLGSKQSVSVTLTGVPYEKGANEENVVVTDSITFFLKGEPKKEEVQTGFWGSKGTMGGSTYDHEAYRKNETIQWNLQFSKSGETKTLEKLVIKDMDLDDRLYYSGLSIRGDYSAEYRLKIETIFEDGSSKVIANGISVKDNQDFAFDRKDIKEIILTVPQASLFKNNMLFIDIDTKIKDYTKPLIIDDINDAFTNKAVFEVQYENEAMQTSEKVAISTINRIEPKVYLDRTIEKNSKNFFVNELVNTELSIGVQQIVEQFDEVELNSVIEILPEGIHYVEGTSKITVHEQVQTDLDLSNVEPQVVYDYKGTGKTALVWDLNTVKLKGEGKFHENISDLVKISYQSKISDFANKGENEFDAYLKMDDQDYFTPKNAESDSHDIYEGKYDDIENNKGTIHFIPAKELLIKKEVQGSLNDNYRLTPNIGHTEFGKQVKFRITIMNNRDDAIETLHLLDVFPFQGDDALFHTSNRNSTLQLRLKEIKGLPEEFLISYTSDLPEGDLSEYYREANWSNEKSNLENVQAIKLDLKEGVKLESEYKKSFELIFDVPNDDESGLDHHISNSVFTSTNHQLDFIESNTAKADIRQHLIKGVIFEDHNKDGVYSPEIDAPLSGVTVQLYDEEDTPVLNAKGEVIQTKTNLQGEYSLGVMKPGVYKVKVSNMKAYEVSDQGEIRDTKASHINEDYLSHSVELNEKNNIAILNAGLYRKLVDITVEKEWIGGPQTRPEIEIQLYRDGEAYGEAVILKDGETSYTWTDLELTNKDGKAYKYTVDELNVPENYEKEIEGLKITNHYVIPKTDITVEKEWIGGPQTHPEIEIQLYRDGEAYGEAVILKDGETSYTWTDLDLTNKDGKAYKYTVDELNVPKNYEKEIEGLKIINRYKEEPVEPETPDIEDKDTPETPDIEDSDFEKPENEDIEKPETEDKETSETEKVGLVDNQSTDKLPQTGMGVSISFLMGLLSLIIGVLLLLVLENKKEME